MLQECGYPIITEFFVNVDNQLENEITFQQGGANPHFNGRMTVF